SILLGFSIIVLILIFTVSVFSLNYKLSTLETKVSESTSKFSSNNYEIDKSQTLYLYLEDRETLGKYLENSIIKNLEKEGYKVELISEFKENYENQTLLISLPEKNIKYNPFLPTSRIRMVAYYTSSGDTEYFYDFKKENNPPVVMRSEDGYTGELIIVSKIVLDNTGKGIITLNAYREDLSNSLGTSVGKIMK
ncbi:MAG: hypothetical protein GKC00_06770, partial [Candidatus Methanofastidiosa archaeon]|nr:hypothetical protein [Candidatus Methanofastidiosa archaeon]